MKTSLPSGWCQKRDRKQNKPKKKTLSRLMREDHTEILKVPNVFKRNMMEDDSRVEGRCCRLRLVPETRIVSGCFFAHFEIASGAVWLPESFSIFPLCVPLLSINYGWQRKHPTFPRECGSHPEATRVILEDTDRWALLWLSSGTRGWMMDHSLLSSPALHFLLLFHSAKNNIQIFGIIPFHVYTVYIYRNFWTIKCTWI